MVKKENMYSFEQSCIDHNRADILGYWDYDLNKISPSEVSYKSNKYYYFKCPDGLHESRKINICNLTVAISNGKDYTICIGCSSIGQKIINENGKEYLDKIWSDKNTKSYYDVYSNSTSKIWLRCLNDDSHPDYDLSASNYAKSHNCPYCAGKRVCLENSLATRYPQVLSIWSDKNEKSPYDYTYGTSSEVWWKCENNKHEEYKRKISQSLSYDFRCPQCGRENMYHPSGPDNPSWKGGVSPEAMRIRKSKQYKDWRDAVMKRDNYTCQCCFQYGGKLNVHHIHDFATFVDERFDLQNGITLCVNCHDSTIAGSFHNIYGTHYISEIELEEYINNKRKELGIDIPFNIDEYIYSSTINEEIEFNNHAEETWYFNKHNILKEDIA